MSLYEGETNAVPALVYERQAASGPRSASLMYQVQWEAHLCAVPLSTGSI